MVVAFVGELNTGKGESGGGGRGGGLEQGEPY